MPYQQKNSPFKQTTKKNKTTSKEDPQALKNLKSSPYFPEEKPARVRVTPVYGDVNIPSEKELNYTGGKTAKEYNTSLKKSRASQGLPTENYTERFHNARNVVRGAANLGNISKEKKSSMLQSLHDFEHNTAPYTERKNYRGYQYGYSPKIRTISNKNYEQDLNRAEKVLMGIESQFENNYKNRSKQKITGAFGSELRRMQYNRKGWAQDRTTKRKNKKK